MMLSSATLAPLVVLVLSLLGGSVSCLGVEDLEKHQVSKSIMETRHMDPRLGCVRFGVDMFHNMGRGEISMNTPEIESEVANLIEQMKNELNMKSYDRRMKEEVMKKLNLCSELLGLDHDEEIPVEVDRLAELEYENLLLKQTIVSMKRLIENIEKYVDLADVEFPKVPLFEIPLPGPIENRQ